MSPERVVEQALAADPSLAFGNGRCFAMFAHLRRHFGTRARAWYDGDHITTEIDGRHYDSRGAVVPRPNATPLAHVGRRAVSQLRRHAERTAA